VRRRRLLRELPRALRQIDLPACTASGHQCTCSWHAWPGFFR
jgi:hypothetical protein